MRVSSIYILSISAIAAAAFLARDNSALFVPYFGALHPVVAVIVVSGIGILALGYLQKKSWQGAEPDKN